MTTDEDTDKAIAMVTGRAAKERSLIVSEARPQTSRVVGNCNKLGNGERGDYDRGGSGREYRRP